MAVSTSPTFLVVAGSMSFCPASALSTAPVSTTMSAGVPARNLSAMVATAPNSPSIVHPVIALNSGVSASASPCAAPPLRIFSVFMILLCLAIDRFDDGSPFQDVAAQECIELCRGHRHWCGALIGPERGNLRSLHSIVDGGIQRCDHRRRCARGRHDAKPDGCLVAGNA